MLATPNLRRLKNIWSFFLGAALMIFVVKYTLMVNLNSGETNKESKDVVRLDSGLLTPFKKGGKTGELVISVSQDDLDDITGKASETEVPSLPHILLHDPYLCQKTPNLNFIFYVHSSSVNRVRRDLLRKTFANTKLFKDKRFVVVFMLGLPKEMGVQQEVKKEFDEHGDIVQGYFIDDYRNITLKAVMGLNWINNHCSQAPYAIKIDDDTFMNIFEILPILEANLNRSLVLICPIWREGTMRVLRERKTCMKWCVTKREFPEEFYPRYCAGIGYVLSKNLIPLLIEAAKKTPFFWIDDVYITGILTQPLVNQIHYIDLISHLTINENHALEQFTNASQSISTYLTHVRNKDNVVPLWKHLLNRLTPEQIQTVSEFILKSFG